jgi:hypothetical protein
MSLVPISTMLHSWISILFIHDTLNFFMMCKQTKVLPHEEFNSFLCVIHRLEMLRDVGLLTY